MKSTLYQLITAPFTEPYVRYQHADVLHAIRLGTAVILALLANKLTNLPHGEWTTITVFIILGLLQYQGAIYTKAKERVLGTLLGIGTALGVLWFIQNAGAWLWIDYALIGILSGIIGYLAVRKLGYTGLLTGITMLMIVSDLGHNSIGQDGIYRALNILLGTGVSVAVTLILPLKSTLMWRFLLSSNLDACSSLYAGVGNHIDAADGAAGNTTHKSNPVAFSAGEVPVDRALVTTLQQINKRLLAVRPHIAATASESGIEKETLETIQRTHRNIIGTIDLLLSAAPRLANIEIDEEVFRPITRIAVSEYPSVQHLAFEWQGYFWLTQTLQTQLQQLSDLLQTSKPHWFAASGLGYQRREQRRMKEQGGETDLHL